MSEIPDSLEAAIAQAKTATLNALEAGCPRLQVELVLPEIALEAQRLAREFADLFADYGSGLRLIFPDTGAAALARRDWGEVPFQVGDLGSRLTPIESKLSDDDQLLLLVSPSAIEVERVEKLCKLAGDRPVILLTPQLESVATVGIGYAARQLRDRFLSTLETAYYLRPFEGGALTRRFPQPWQVWLETEDEGYQLLAEEATKPVGDRLERLLTGATETAAADSESDGKAKPKKPGFLASMQQFLRALSQ
ncbi:MAG: DUF1995 family protein [Spirulinaceae cyanobacterium RM2_2_10]|nr:DUF1995 family protein [Spirulinaceae cyanobacterium SM2_1_0]NJO19729.1 DUF1995 family protein [Spirulinaceae cyanobacterium RM2_2_10]